MNKIENFKFSFNYLAKPESERLAEIAYSKVFLMAFENLVNKQSKRFIMKAEDINGKK